MSVLWNILIFHILMAKKRVFVSKSNGFFLKYQENKQFPGQTKVVPVGNVYLNVNEADAFGSTG